MEDIGGPFVNDDELQRFLDELERMAPLNPAGTRVVYREVLPDEAVNEAGTPDEEEITGELGQPEGADVEAHQRDQDERPVVEDFHAAAASPIVAVDCGIVRLGETENGLVIALRATMVSDGGAPPGELYRSGSIYLHNDHKVQVLHQIGRHLGDENLFVRIDRNQQPAQAVAVKAGVADDAHQYGDRFRNWLERLVQRIAVNRIENGIVLLDGALTLRTRDTPQAFIHNLAHAAGIRGNALIGLSKQSRLLIRSRPIRFWLNDVPNRSCFRELTALMDQGEGAERVLGSLFAVRFSPVGPTFRVDVVPAPGQTTREALNQLYASALMRGGYPDLLVRAHTFSYFTSPDVLALQAQAGARYALVPQAEPDLSGIFGPFGGRFK